MEYSTLAPAEKRALLVRFADVFVDPSRRQDFLAALGSSRPIDYDRFLRVEHVRVLPPAGGSLSWLAARERGARCHRLERQIALPALDLRVASLEERWAASWPGMLLSLPAGRALVVTLDYELIHFELRGSTPYR